MTEELLRSLLAGYSLRWDGVHGLGHWGRVMENGRRLAELTGADVRVVELFALFHDCRRINEGTDPGHGRRGGKLARTLFEAGALELSGVQFVQIHYACEHHTDGLLAADTTVETCWDADRLDLGRVRITPEPRYLCTSAAKDPAMIEWAEERSRSDHRTPEVDRWFACWAAASVAPGR
ncbi:MAG: HD domain-containing protein [Thermoanaerobaculia bacterium]